MPSARNPALPMSLGCHDVLYARNCHDIVFLEELVAPRAIRDGAFQLSYHYIRC